MPASPQAELTLRRRKPEAPSAEQRALLAKLAELDVDSLSARAALELLYELAQRAKKD